jgi:hypothetical protein
MNALVSENYRKLNASLHASATSYGTSGARWAPVVKHIALSAKCDSILDYGCGKQTLKKALPELKIAGYDPAIPELANMPRRHDFVVCTDVLEHVEPELLGNVLDNLGEVMGSVGLLVISTRPAKKILDDGRNAHLIQEHPTFWLKQFRTRFNVLCFQFSERHSELFVLVTPRARTRPIRYLSSMQRRRLIKASFPEIMTHLVKIWKWSWNGIKGPTNKKE